VTATLLFVRHAAHTDFGERFTGRADGVALSPTGAVQARKLADRLADAPISAIYASPRTRAAQTAAAIAERHGLDVETAHEVDEIDLGSWTGRRIAELEGDPAFTRWNTERASAAPPGGEPMAAVADRAAAFASRTAAARPGETVAVVTHADVIRGLVARVLGLSLDNLLRFEVDPASVTRMLFGDWGAKLLSLNEGEPA
jgi:broad specificity phosphatase PhoE